MTPRTVCHRQAAAGNAVTRLTTDRRPRSRANSLWTTRATVSSVYVTRACVGFHVRAAAQQTRSALSREFYTRVYIAGF